MITDGEVTDRSVQDCDKIFEEAQDKQHFKIDKSICYIICSGSDAINMSVTCPFTRFCESQIFTKKKTDVMQTIAQYTP